ncbi:MAG TPA: DPP IV N-terminal domain-containing protein, partial [Blastocatellia bacterium]
MNRIRRIPITLLVLLVAMPLFAQQPARQLDSSLLTLDTIFSYSAKSLGWHQWQADGSGYMMLEPSAARENALDIVRYDAASGAKTILVSAQNLTPPGAQSPLTIEEFTLSADNSRLLIFTNSARVWRSNTRGDYWFFDLNSKKLKRLGDFAKPSTLMFAKFSPDATRVGYVHENNLYVENLTNGRVTQLTTDGAQYTVNGTFDWVYEEELFCRDGFRWSPDGKHIAYWQLDSSGVKEFKMINNTEELYPKIISFPYPKAGEMNSAARVGVINADGGKTQWFEVPGDARNNYLPRMEWAASSSEVVIQQLNRLQNTNVVMIGDARTGKVRPVLTEKENTWVDVSWGAIDWDRRGLARGDVEWIEGGKRFLWVSERDGWRHVYSVSRDGSDVKCITPGNYDLIGVELVDVPNGWIYFSASPENATQKYLFRTRLDGSSKAERLSPANQPGTHNYTISPRGDLAIHTYSAAARVPMTDVVRFPQHAVVRTM